MVGSYLVPYAIRSSSSSLLFRPLLACYQNPTLRRRSIQTRHDNHGRAASTAEEFLKIAEEKAEQGIKSKGARKDSDNNLMKKATTDKERLKPVAEDESSRKTRSLDGSENSK